MLAKIFCTGIENSICGYNVKRRIDAERFLKVTGSHAGIFICDNYSLNKERKTIQCNLFGNAQLKPNSIMLSGSKLVRSWWQTSSELKFDLSSSFLAAN